MESRTITITSAAKDYGNLNLSSCGKEFFPNDVYGGSSRKSHPGNPVILKATGIDHEIKTDIPTDRNSGRPRWLFRERKWVKEFVSLNKLRINIYCMKSAS